MDASVGVGQANFADQLTTSSQSVTPTAAGVAISPTGKMAICEQGTGRVLIWNSVPTTDGVPADVVVGKPDFTSTTSGTTAANNKGVWRSAGNGGALTLVLRTGDTMVTTQGTKTIQNVDFPGSNTTDHRWEQPVMDSTGRLLVYVTFVGGATTKVLVP